MSRTASVLLIYLTFLSLTNAKAVDLVSPSDYAVVPDTVVEFLWNKASGSVITYQLQLATDSLFSNLFVDQSGLTAQSFTVTGLLMGQRYWWRVRYFESGLPSGWSVVFNYKVFSPMAVPGILAWLEPETGVTLSGTQVQSWHSKTGSYTLSQANISQRPGIQDTLLFGRNGLRFDGVDDFLEGPFLNSQALTIIVVHNPLIINTTLFSQARFTYSGFNWHINNSSRLSLGCLQTPSNTGIIFVGKPYPFNIPSSTFTVDGLAVSNQGIRLFTGQSDTATLQTVSFLDNPSITFSRLGAMGNNSAFYNGIVYEIVIVDTILSASSYMDIYDYLMWKYQPPVNLGADIHLSYSFCDTTLQPSHQYKSYIWSTGDTTAFVKTSNPGTYWLSVTDFLGRTSVDTVKVFREVPHSALSDTIICPGGQATLTTGITGQYVFMWNNNPSLNQPVINTSAGGIYTVIITDSFNCSIYDTVAVNIDDYSQVMSLGPDRSVCSGDTLSLVAGANQTVSYQWNTGPGDTLPFVVANAGGSYIVNTTNIRGCPASSQINVLIKSLPPTVDFVLSSTPACTNDTLVFQNLSYSMVPGDPVSSWRWYVNDSLVTNSKDAKIVSALSGDYTVMLFAITDSGCVAHKTDSFSVLTSPSVHITHSKTCTGNPVSFTTSTMGQPINQFLWLFQNDISGTDTALGANPAFLWNSPGSYLVRLVADDIQGCTGRDSVTLHIVLNPAPSISVSPDPACDNITITFSDTGLADPLYPVDFWQWDFDDGTPPLVGQSNPTHIYSSPGEFDVRLIVENTVSGCNDSTSRKIIIGNKPRAVVVCDDIFCSSKSMTLTDSSFVVNDSITQWIWDSDLHGKLYGKNPVVVFPDTGSYQVRLTVVSSYGCTDTDSALIAVFKSPKALFSMNPVFGNPPLTVSYENLSDGADSYLWDFGDGNQSAAINPVYTYPQKGKFNVLLFASSANGCVDSHSDTVYTISPYLNVELTKIEASLSNDILRVVVEFKNNSSVELSKVDILSWLNGEYPFVESWVAANTASRLKPGYTQRYELNSGFYVAGDKYSSKNLICAIARVPEFPDNISPDKQRCIPFRHDFYVNDPYPNPARSFFMLDVVADIPDIISLAIYNVHGQKISSDYQVHLESGLNTLRLPVSQNMPQGLYYITINYRDKFENRKIVVLKP